MLGRSLLLALLLLGGSGRAADFEVRSPVIDPGEFELDIKAAAGFDRRPERSDEHAFVAEFEYGLTEWWSPALEIELGREAGPDEATHAASFTFENRFQLTPEGKYWLDAGLFLEYEHATVRDVPDVVRVGPLLRKELAATQNTLNLFAVKRLGGAHAGPGYAYAWQTRWPVAELLQPGFEIYGGSGEAETAAVQHRGGPVLSGVVRLGGGHDVRYELGYLRGFNRATPDSTVKLLIGYEVQF